MLGIIMGVVEVVCAIAKLVPALLKIIGPALIKLAEALDAFFKALGIEEAGQNTEELGDKALQAEEDLDNPIKCEDFDSYEKYVQALKDYQLDPEKSKLIPEEEKIQKGIELKFGLAIEKFGENMGEFGTVIFNNYEFFSQKGLLVEIGKEVKKDETVLPSIVDYVYGNSKSTVESDKAFDTLVNAVKSIDPEKAEEAIWVDVANLKK